jgi:hypothetical protein
MLMSEWDVVVSDLWNVVIRREFFRRLQIDDLHLSASRVDACAKARASSSCPSEGYTGRSHSRQAPRLIGLLNDDGQVSSTRSSRRLPAPLRFGGTICTGLTEVDRIGIRLQGDGGARIRDDRPGEWAPLPLST